jgi:hypothetical protein
MIDLDPVSVIKSIAPKAATLLINQVQRNEAVIKILKELKLDPAQPPKDVDGVYAYALVEYGVYKPEPILQLFRERAIKNAFWQAYTANTPFGFIQEVENFLKSNVLGDDIQESRINIRAEIEEFGEAFVKVAKRTKSSEFEPYPEWNLDVYPAEFKALIQDKTRVFCGRVFVFQAFERFLRENKKGYFTVIGDAGMGKTAIASKYVYACKCPCYFNSRSDGRNRPEFFLESIRKQLIKRYNLQNAARDNLATLLEKVSQELLPNERVVILVDALDEVNQEKRTNLLELPDTLPDGVYFLLTRRPYYTLNNKRLYLSPDTPTKELDLSLYVDLSREDVKQYIQYFLYQDPEHQDSLRTWINDRQITPEIFVEQMAEKSQNNFMYLRYILPAIARGFYNDLDLKQLPEGLQNYYQVHWERMGMNDKPQEDKVIILFILVAIPTPITCEIIAGITEQGEYEVQQVLDEWVEYVKQQEIEGEICYNIYHASFLDFLTEKPILGEKRKLFEKVRVNVADFLY